MTGDSRETGPPAPVFKHAWRLPCGILLRTHHPEPPEHIVVSFHTVLHTLPVETNSCAITNASRSMPCATALKLAVQTLGPLARDHDTWLHVRAMRS